MRQGGYLRAAWPALLLLLTGCLGGEQGLQRPPEAQHATTPPTQSATRAPERDNGSGRGDATASGVAADATPDETGIPVENPTFKADRSDLDPDNPAYPILQDPEQAMGDFPTDRYGQIDWVRALQQGEIAPRAERTRPGKMEIRNNELLLKSTREMPYVKFPHQQHSEWLACNNCHPSPFIPKAGANHISMDSILRGNDCGLCHDRVAFTIMACERCHSVPHPGSPPKWW